MEYRLQKILEQLIDEQKEVFEACNIASVRAEINPTRENFERFEDTKKIFKNQLAIAEAFRERLHVKDLH